MNASIRPTFGSLLSVPPPPPVFNVNAESESTLSRVEYTIPKNIKLNGAGFPTCSGRTRAS
ncbi:MAG: hypothetical protein WKF94_06245 [Solirubrobacteraceae bacterium]